MNIVDIIPQIRSHNIKKLILEGQGPLTNKNEFQWSNGNYESVKAISRLLPFTLIEIDLINRRLIFLNGEEYTNVTIPS